MSGIIVRYNELHRELNLPSLAYGEEDTSFSIRLVAKEPHHMWTGDVCRFSLGFSVTLPLHMQLRLWTYPVLGHAEGIVVTGGVQIIESTHTGPVVLSLSRPTKGNRESPYHRLLPGDVIARGAFVHERYLPFTNTY